MSDQHKTLIAYVVGLSIMLFAWSVFRTWEPPVPLAGSGAAETAQASATARGISPTRVAAE